MAGVDFDGRPRLESSAVPLVASCGALCSVNFCDRQSAPKFVDSDVILPIVSSFLLISVSLHTRPPQEWEH